MVTIPINPPPPPSMLTEADALSHGCGVQQPQATTWANTLPPIAHLGDGFPWAGHLNWSVDGMLRLTLTRGLKPILQEAGAYVFDGGLCSKRPTDAGEPRGDIITPEALLETAAKRQGAWWHSLSPRGTYPVLILNTSICTMHGAYSYSPLPEDAALRIVQTTPMLSAVGHSATAAALSELLGVDVPVNRIQAEQQVGQGAIVFKLNGHLPEGAVLSRAELERVGWSLGFLVRQS